MLTSSTSRGILMMKYVYLLASIFMANFSLAEEVSIKGAEQKALAAYQQAIEKVSKGWSAISPEQKITFKKLVKPQSEAQQAYQNKLWLTSDGSEVVEANVESETGSSNLNWQHRILLDPSRLPAKPKLLKQTDSTWIFELPVNVGVDAEDEESVDESKVNLQIEKALTAELSVSKLAPRLVSHKIFAPKPFKPEAMVTVNKFHIRIEYQQAWLNGPWVTQSISREVEGKYAFFLSVNEFSNTTYTDFQLMK